MQRVVLAVGGGDREEFLQGLVTNDVAKLKDGLVYAALLSAQGKYLADFFMVPDEDRILIDVAEPLAADLQKRLGFYKLRADVTIEKTDIAVTCGIGDAPDGAFTDPRDPNLGWRLYGAAESPEVNWDALRVAHGIPEGGIELIPNESYILEMGFERLNGVDFRKGCYVGQEVTARMKHKTELRKGLAVVALEGEVPAGTAITRDGKPVGTVYTQAGGQGLAYLRFDRADAGMTADGVTVSRLDG
ncbi:CAF17-like 4Fe-4S cluster assembly/insertion protein YgfZ [Litoreibacter roseus]|uniref:Aminomethyltransferase n=1 Tax=Litoreibacter roseus TaxID=2601869 RepID=A0A6N6JC92_9RHOB|nr:folate-binding protein [Litoreibacter roseus]GFE63460.1 aminomethyltransferase [Litoreibacter roseus]